MPTFKDWIGGRTAEGTPADADELYLRDDSGNISKRITYSGLKTAIDAVTNAEVDADIKTLALPADTTISAFGATVIDDADAAAARTTLGAAPLASPTFTGDVVVPDADADAEALNRQTGDTRYSPPRHATGRDYVTGYGARTAETLVADRLFLAPIEVGAQTVTFDRLAIQVTTAGGAGSVCRLGIYNGDANGQPSALILDAGTVDTASTGIKELSISQAATATAGVLWVGVAAQVASGPVIYGMSGANPLCSAVGTANAFDLSMGALQTLGITGALPDPFSTSAAARRNAPMVAYRFSAIS